MHLAGIHHLTAITADASANLRFYTRVLGMRLVKKTVNQDDVSAYHLFYADGRGSPGTDLTFFDWPVEPERRGTRSIARTGLRVKDGESLDWWRERLAVEGVSSGGIRERDDRLTMDFEDPEGQRLSLVVDSRTDGAHPWEKSPVPAERQLLGLGPVTVSVTDLDGLHLVLKNLLNMRPVRKFEEAVAGETREVHVYEMGNGGPAAQLHVRVEPGAAPARQGAGGVHHLAFRTTQADYLQWVKRLSDLGVPNSGPVDRFYFQSLYFREPNGILFEIATDEPGFATDEPMETMGNGLVLPPFLEPQRPQIEAGLKPL